MTTSKAPVKHLKLLVDAIYMGSFHVTSQIYKGYGFHGLFCGLQVMFGLYFAKYDYIKNPTNNFFATQVAKEYYNNVVSSTSPMNDNSNANTVTTALMY